MPFLMKFVLALVPVVALAFLAFLLGSYAMFAETYTSTFLGNAFKGGQAVWDRYTNYRHPFFSRFHQKARTEQRGVTLFDSERAQEGFTLYTSGHDQRAFLISMEGEVVHEWSLPFSRIWDETSPVKHPMADDLIYYRRALLYPNGDLLVLYVASGDTPWGYGVARITWDSELVWLYLGQAHHDMDIGSDGKIYLLTHEIGHDVIEEWTDLKPPRIDDFIVVLSPEGEELRKISVTEALVASRYRRLLTRLPGYVRDSGDYLHTNSIDIIEEAEAATFSHAEAGDVLISMRELGTGAIAVVDLDDEVMTWAQQGVFSGQHDPDILSNGNILIFDNRGHFGDFGESRVMEYDPETREIVWSYVGSEDHPFDSILRSVQERLPNGNTLITESDGGRLLEVAPNGDIVWEYVNPVRGGENDEFIPVISSGERILPDFLEPDLLAISTPES
jgi:hypothetical protein